MKTTEELLNTLLSNAQALRIRQVQLHITHEPDRKDFKARCDKAWDEFNRAHQELYKRSV